MSINLAGPKISFSLIHAIWSLQCAPGRLLQRQSEPPVEHRNWQRNTYAEHGTWSWSHPNEAATKLLQWNACAHAHMIQYVFSPIFYVPAFQENSAIRRRDRSMLQPNFSGIVYCFHTSARLWALGSDLYCAYGHSFFLLKNKSSEMLMYVFRGNLNMYGRGTTMNLY